MSTKAVPLGLRLFLEGIEVPVISAQVTIQPDRPAVSAIQIIPSDMALHLLPRTLVHLFYLDDDVVPYTNRTVRVSDGVTESEQQRFDAPDAAYKLLFTGEVIGYNFSKNPSSRQLVIQCMDLSSYWDTCYQWFADYSVGGGGLTDKSHTFIGAGSSMFNSVAGGHQWVIGRILNTKPRSHRYQKAGGLLAGIIHLLEAIGGIRYTKEDPGFNGVNDFFTIAELRYNLLGMLGAVEKDETSAKIYNNKAFRSWLRNGMTSLGTLMSFRDILNHVCRHIYHHTYPNPCAYFKDGGEGTRTINTQSSLFTDTASGQTVKKIVEAAVTAISAAWSMVDESFSGTYIPQVYPKTKGALKHIKTAKLAMESIKSDDRDDVTSILGNAKGSLERAIELFKEIGYEEETEELLEGFYATSGQVGNEKEVMGKLREIFADVLNTLGPSEGLLSPKQRTKGTSNKKVVTLEGANLFSQLLLPETFFVSPPRCNVFFPDRYNQFNFSRNFMREVTRLSCRGGLGMIAGGRRGAALMGRTYFAPDIKDARGKNLYATMTAGARILLPHETHSGIIPKFEWVTDGHRYAWKGAKETGKRDDFHKAGKVGYLQRLTNFQFYLHRWAARTMSISGVFNPYTVLGLPALVMDKSMPAPAVQRQIETALGRRWLPVQYLGKVAHIAHSISQSGGQTQVNFTHCRTHRGLDDEFLGTLIKEVELTKGVRYSRKFQVSQLINSISEDEYRAASREDLLGSKYGNKLIIKDKDDLIALVGAYAQGKLVEGQLVPRTIKAFRGSKVKKIKTSGNILTLDAETAWGELKVNPTTTTIITRTEWQQVGSSSSDLASGEGEGEWAEIEVNEKSQVLEIYDKFDITFEKQVNTGEFRRTKRSIEEALAPGWYSDIWSNEKITEGVYAPLLGTAAVSADLSKTEYAGALAIVDRLDLEAKEQDELLDRSFDEDVMDQTYEVSEGAGQVKTSTETTTSTTSLDNITKMEVIPGSIEEAVDSLVITYSLLRLRGGDVHDFIKQYIKRPIADMEQVLGSHNLSFDAKGNVDPDIEGYVREGFHSRAFGDYNTDVKLPDREGAVPEPGKDALKALFPGEANPSSITRKNIFNRGNPPSAILPELDPRGRARARVLLYVQELTVSRGLLG